MLKHIIIFSLNKLLMYSFLATPQILQLSYRGIFERFYWNYVIKYIRIVLKKELLISNPKTI